MSQKKTPEKFDNIFNNLGKTMEELFGDNFVQDMQKVIDDLPNIINDLVNQEENEKETSYTSTKQESIKVLYFFHTNTSNKEELSKYIDLYEYNYGVFSTLYGVQTISLPDNIKINNEKEIENIIYNKTYKLLLKASLVIELNSNYIIRSRISDYKEDTKIQDKMLLNTIQNIKKRIQEKEPKIQKIIVDLSLQYFENNSIIQETIVKYRYTSNMNFEDIKNDLFNKWKNNELSTKKLFKSQERNIVITFEFQNEKKQLIFTKN